MTVDLKTIGPTGPTPTVSAKAGIWKLALPGMLLAVACLLPYLNKAFTIDDPWFILEARQILKTPLQPMSYPICWMEPVVCASRAGEYGTGQGFMGYALVPAALTAHPEIAAHLTQILLAWLAIFAMVRLALRLGFDRMQAAMAGLMLVAIPPFLSMANTAMPDIAALALSLNGLERLLAWKEERRWHQAVLAGLGLGLAAYTRLHTVMMIPLGALWLLIDIPVRGVPLRNVVSELRRRLFLFAPLVGAFCVLVAVNYATRDRGPVDVVTDPHYGHGILMNLYSYLLYFAFPIPLAAVWMLMRFRNKPMALLLPAVPPLVFHFMSPKGNIPGQWTSAAVLYGLIVLIHILYSALRERDGAGVLLWLWLLLPAPAVVYHHLPIKYLVPVLPAVVLLLVRTLAALPRPRELAAYKAIVLVCAAYSCLLLRADLDFAEYGRRVAAELIAPHRAAGEKVWFSSQWGLYWYAQEAGARVVDPRFPGPQPGDLLLAAWMEGGVPTRDRYPKRELVDSRNFQATWGRTMGYGAGLYSNYCGFVPWVWDREGINRYELWRIR